MPERDESANPTLIFSRESIQSVDREAVESFGIPGIVLMENAALGLAEHVPAALGRAVRGAAITICCGSGNNGGDGYALARHLANRGGAVTIIATGSSRPGSDAAVNEAICRSMGLGIVASTERTSLAESDLIVDALFGTGLRRPVEGAAAELIDWMNGSDAPILAVDVPSGLDCESGVPLGACVRATITVTFVGWKLGFLHPEAAKRLGRMVVADIGAPRELYERLGRRMTPAETRRA